MKGEPDQQNIAHFGFHIENFDEVLDTCKRLNVPVTRNQEWEHSQSVYIQDPNGYDIELSKIQGGGL
jgi:lactoylglutathione lyase